MLLCIYMVFVTVLTLDVVQSECVPDDPLRVRDEEFRVHGNEYLRCYIDNVCQNSQSFVFYKCDVNGENCEKMFAYFVATDSVSFYGNTNRPISPSYSKDSSLLIRLYNVQITDDGIWKIFIRSIGSDYECVNYNVTTYVRPKEGMRITPLKENVPTNKKFNLTCQVNQIRPAYRLYFKINGFQFKTGTQIDTPNGDTWNISYITELVLSPMYPLKGRCVITHKYHWQDWTNSEEFVINPREGNPLTFYPSKEVVIGCAIPVNFSLIGWTKNNIPVSNNDGYTATRSSEVKGFFNFTDPDVTTAQYSELKFVLPSLSQGCDAINEYSGDYACEAINTDFSNTFRSAARHLFVEYAPTLESSKARTYDVFTLSGANVIIVCPLCSYPPVEEYKWLKGNIEVGNERTLLVPYVTENGFGKYTCSATNTMGFTNVTVNVIKIADGKTKLYQGNIHEEIILDCPLCNDREKACNWEIKDKQIHAGRFYTIESLTEEDYGEYICTAVFASGRVWMRVSLDKPRYTDPESPAIETTIVGETDKSTAVNIRTSKRQEGHLPTTKVVTGFAVVGIVVVGMIIAITVLSCILVRRQKSKDDATRELSANATTSEETPHIYEKINVTFGNNPVYENTHPHHASNHM